MFRTGKAYQSIKKEITANNKLEAVIAMPSGVFQPYSGVSTAIMIFTKTTTGGTDNVWFYDMLADGKSLDTNRKLLVEEEIFEAFSFGDGSASFTDEQKRTLHDKFNLPEIIQRFENRKNEKRERTEQSFLVPFEEIKKNDWDLSINQYKKIIYEEIEYDDPKVILNRIHDLEQDRKRIMDRLKQID
jgi:type I restriction enzyme M protein